MARLIDTQYWDSLPKALAAGASINTAFQLIQTVAGIRQLQHQIEPLSAQRPAHRGEWLA